MITALAGIGVANGRIILFLYHLLCEEVDTPHKSIKNFLDLFEAQTSESQINNYY